MMLEFWDKIAYMVQFLAACMIFMIPARKKRRFLVRTGAAACLLILTSYGVNSIWGVVPQTSASILYWGFYVIACIWFVMNGMDGNLLQAVYCVICASGMQHIAFDVYLIYEIAGGRSYVVPVLIFAASYLLIYRTIVRKLPENGMFVVSKSMVFPIATIIVLVWIFSTLEDSAAAGFEAGMWHRIVYRMIDALCCIYVLWVQKNQKENMSLQRELNGINEAWRQQKKQYEVVSETIDSINRKCHDLKYQIRMIRDMADGQQKTGFLDEIEKDIMIYDSAIDTGNKALDVVLMEKGLYCKTHGIQWSCMADGRKLDFMKLEDIYAIFGNALDNAVRAVSELKNTQKKIISVKIITQNSLLMIQIQNYFEGERRFEDGLPVTTKKNRKDHGYGMKSIRYTAEKYNGTITVQAENQIFMLQILIPIPETA